jgi:hypothetical protein
MDHFYGIAVLITLATSVVRGLDDFLNKGCK